MMATPTTFSAHVSTEAGSQGTQRVAMAGIEIRTQISWSQAT